MENDKIIKIAATGFVVLVVIPSVLNAGTNVLTATVNGISKIKYNHKIKKGLKDGSIVEIDGRYYEVQDIEEA